MPTAKKSANPDPYTLTIMGIIVDPYRIALMFGVDPVIAQAVKKLLRCGRKHKETIVDVKEAMTTLQRWMDIKDEDLTIARYEQELSKKLEAKPKSRSPRKQ